MIIRRMLLITVLGTLLTTVNAQELSVGEFDGEQNTSRTGIERDIGAVDDLTMDGVGILLLQQEATLESFDERLNSLNRRIEELMAQQIRDPGNNGGRGRPDPVQRLLQTEKFNKLEQKLNIVISILCSRSGTNDECSKLQDAN